MWLDSNRTPYDSKIVAAVNAYYYLTGASIPDVRYEHLIEISGARTKEPDIEVVWNELGIEVEEKLHIRNTVDMAMWKFYEGLIAQNHSIGICRLNMGLFRTMNSGLGDHRFITSEPLLNALVLNEDETEPRWNVRSFRLKK